MALTAKLAHFNPSTVNGIVASIEDTELTFSDCIEIVHGNGPTKTVSEVCQMAAKKLRKLANDFEQLAKEEKPFSEATHIRVRQGRSK